MLWVRLRGRDVLLGDLKSPQCPAIPHYFSGREPGAQSTERMDSAGSLMLRPWVVRPATSLGDLQLAVGLSGLLFTSVELCR